MKRCHLRVVLISTIEDYGRVTAIILVGGAATRMRPLSLGKSKCMIPFIGNTSNPTPNPSVDIIWISTPCIDFDRRGGRYQAISWRGTSIWCSIDYHHTEAWSGTAGAVKHAVLAIVSSEVDGLLVVYGDSLLQASFQEMLQFHRETGSWCTALYHRPRFEAFLYKHPADELRRGEKRTNYGVMQLDTDGRITRMVEKPPLGEIEEGSVANAAVYLLRREVLDLVSSDQACDFARDLFPLLNSKGIPCYGFDIGQGYRIDEGTLRTLQRPHGSSGWTNRAVTSSSLSCGRSCG